MNYSIYELSLKIVANKFTIETISLFISAIENELARFMQKSCIFSNNNINWTIFAKLIGIFVFFLILELFFSTLPACILENPLFFVKLHPEEAFVRLTVDYGGVPWSPLSRENRNVNSVQ